MFSLSTTSDVNVCNVHAIFAGALYRTTLRFDQKRHVCNMPASEGSDT